MIIYNLNMPVGLISFLPISIVILRDFDPLTLL